MAQTMSESIKATLDEQGKLLQQCTEKYSAVIGRNQEIATQIKTIADGLKNAQGTLGDIQKQHSEFNTEFNNRIKSIEDQQNQTKQKQAEAQKELENKLQQQQDQAKADAETAKQQAEKAKNAAIAAAQQEKTAAVNEAIKKQQQQALEAKQAGDKVHEEALAEKQKAMEGLQNQQTELDKQHKEALEQLQRQGADKDTQIQTLQQQMEEQKQQNDKALRDMKTAAEEASKKTKQEHNNAIETLKLQNQEAIKELNTQLEAANKKVEEDQAALRAKEEEERQLNSARDSERQGLETKLKACEDKVKSSEDYANQKKQELENLRQNFDNVESAAKMKLQEEVENLKQQYEALLGKLNETKAKMSEGSPPAPQSNAKPPAEVNKSIVKQRIGDTEIEIELSKLNKQKNEAITTINNGPEWKDSDTAPEHGSNKTQRMNHDFGGRAQSPDHIIYRHKSNKDGWEYWIIDSDKSLERVAKFNTLTDNEDEKYKYVTWMNPKYHKALKKTHHSGKHHKGGFRYGKASKKSNKRSLKSKLSAKKYSLKIKSKKKGKRGKSKKNRRKSIKIRI